LTTLAPPSPALGAADPRLFFVNLWRTREVLVHLISRNLRSQYKQSILGYAWILLNPISQLATLAFIFSVIFDAPERVPGEAPFTLFIFVGLLPWIFFANAVGSATESITSGSSLITAVYFPREILVVAGVLVRFVDLLAGGLILGVLLLESGQPVTLAALWIPVLFLLNVIFVIGLVMPLAALNLFFHDIRYLVGVIIYLWFFFTPILYSTDTIPERYAIIWDLNPIARMINAYRYALLDGVSPPLGSVLILALAALAALFGGYYLFKKLEPGFADYV
jgi:ABC-type polysaccharide/polyol phosphate export permease